MNDQDKMQFKQLMDGASVYYQKDPMQPMALKIYFNALDRFTLDQVQGAISQHIQDPDQGRFYPKVADIVRNIEGDNLKPEDLVAEANVKESPLGILVLMHIDDFTFNSANSNDVRQAAHNCMVMLPDWKERALRGAYTPREVEVMVKYGVDPKKPFYKGLQPPSNPLELDRLVGLALEKMGDEKKEKALALEYDKKQECDPQAAKRAMAEIMKALGERENG